MSGSTVRKAFALIVLAGLMVGMAKAAKLGTDPYVLRAATDRTSPPGHH